MCSNLVSSFLLPNKQTKGRGICFAVYFSTLAIKRPELTNRGKGLEGVMDLYPIQAKNQKFTPQAGST